jgi:hypothetical protein
MLGTLVAFTILFSAYTAENECRAFPIDYDASECDGLDAHLEARGIPNREYYRGPDWSDPFVPDWSDRAIPASEECGQW